MGRFGLNAKREFNKERDIERNRQMRRVDNIESHLREHYNYTGIEEIDSNTKKTAAEVKKSQDRWITMTKPLLVIIIIVAIIIGICYAVTSGIMSVKP